MAIVTLAGHGLCLLLASVFMHWFDLFGNFFPALPWWRDMDGMIAIINNSILDGPPWEDCYRADNWASLIQLIVMLLIISLTVFAMLLLRRKRACFVWLGIATLLELGMIVAVWGYLNISWEISMSVEESIFFLPLFAVAPILTCFGVKAMRAWMRTSLRDTPSVARGDSSLTREPGD
jgi:hypothetical protein